MAQFTLTWDNTQILSNTNVTGQQAVYRQQSIGGSFIDTGFTPSNPMLKSTITALSPSLTDNIIYEFKIQSLCTENGPIDNDNDIIESINIVCILPIIDTTVTTSTITIDVTGLDITKAKFTLRKSSDDSIVASPVIVDRTGDSIQATVGGLTTATDYYWQINLYSTINGEEIIGTLCTPYNITTL